MVRKLNLVGDAQADLAGHGGEQRAVFVYQLHAYQHWERFSDVKTSSSASSEKTLSNFPITRSVLAIATATVREKAIYWMLVRREEFLLCVPARILFEVKQNKRQEPVVEY
jgi:hypothetical protein